MMELTDGERPVSLKSRVIQQGYCEYWPPNNSSCGDIGDGQILNRLSGVNLRWNFYAKCKEKIMNLMCSRKKIKTQKPCRFRPKSPWWRRRSVVTKRRGVGVGSVYRNNTSNKLSAVCIGVHLPACLTLSATSIGHLGPWLSHDTDNTGNNKWVCELQHAWLLHILARPTIQYQISIELADSQLNTIELLHWQ